MSENSAISVNNTKFCKKVEKNTLKKTVEENKGAEKEANHMIFL
jgi:hypothetical protein